MIKTICVNIRNIDCDTLGSIHTELRKLPLLYKYNHRENELYLTAQPHILALAEKVVAKYV